MNTEFLSRVSTIAFTLSVLFCLSAHAQTTSEAKVSERKFELNYGATVTGLNPGSTVKVWIPIAQPNSHQEITLTGASTPTPMQVASEEAYGNKIGYFELKATDAGLFAFQIDYSVSRKEATVDVTTKTLTDEQKRLYLKANRLVPISGRPIDLLSSTKLPAKPMTAGEQLYDLVEQHMKYDKSKPGYGNGDSEWACDSRTGNCTDFHSLFISLARSQKLPARFEIGFPLPGDKTEGKLGGYHCWAWFHAENIGWCPVDISEADKHPEMKNYYFGRLTADRVAFSTGRDIVLVPKSNSEPLNYFVYPHVEVDGKVWPKEKIKLAFSFADKK